MDAMDTAELRSRVEVYIRERELIPPGGEVTCLVSGGADSTCLWHALRALGYRVSALHVDHGLRGEASAADARFCREVLGAEVVEARGSTTEEELREQRYAVAALGAPPAGSKRAVRGGGPRAARGSDRLWLEHGPVELRGEVRWGPWRIASNLPGLRVRAWRPGDRLAGRRKKIQDVFVDAKVPRSERESWPLVVRGDEVVAVPGIVEALGVEAVREDLWRSSGPADGAGPEGTA